jgi:hypothetical protein
MKTQLFYTLFWQAGKNLRFTKQPSFRSIPLKTRINTGFSAYGKKPAFC